MLRASMTTSPGSASSLSTFSFTARPTIISASPVSDADGAVPTTLPRRMTVIRSPIALTSRRQG